MIYFDAAGSKQRNLVIYLIKDEVLEVLKGCSPRPQALINVADT